MNHCHRLCKFPLWPAVEVTGCDELGGTLYLKELHGSSILGRRMTLGFQGGKELWVEMEVSILHVFYKGNCPLDHYL